MPFLLSTYQLFIFVSAVSEKWPVVGDNDDIIYFFWILLVKSTEGVVIRPVTGVLRKGQGNTAHRTAQVVCPALSVSIEFHAHFDAKKSQQSGINFAHFGL